MTLSDLQNIQLLQSPSNTTSDTVVQQLSTAIDARSVNGYFYFIVHAALLRIKLMMMMMMITEFVVGTNTAINQYRSALPQRRYRFGPQK